MVNRNLKRFLPPIFDVGAYDEETQNWGYDDWWQALLRRKWALETVEAQEYADPGITSGHGSPEFCKEEVFNFLPHLFEESNMNERPRACYFTFGPRVKDMTAERAVEVYQQVQKTPALISIIEHPESSNWEALEDQPVHPLFWETRDPYYAQTWAMDFLVEVNLQAPDVELRRAFDAWLKSARERYKFPEPRPRALHRDSDPVLPEGRFKDWREKRVLAFLDLYIYNRLHNPPPEPTLWKRHKLGWMSYRGESWTVDRMAWIKMLGLPFDMSEPVFNKKVRQRALDLLEPDMLDLLEMHTNAEREKKTGPDDASILVRT